MFDVLRLVVIHVDHAALLLFGEVFVLMLYAAMSTIVLLVWLVHVAVVKSVELWRP